MSNEKNTGYLLYEGDEILTRKERDYFISHEIRIPINQPGFNGMSIVFFFVASDVVLNLDGAKHRNLPKVQEPRPEDGACRGARLTRGVFFLLARFCFWGGQWIGFLEIGDFGDLKHRIPD